MTSEVCRFVLEVRLTLHEEKVLDWIDSVSIKVGSFRNYSILLALLRLVKVLLELSVRKPTSWFFAFCLISSTSWNLLPFRNILFWKIGGSYAALYLDYANVIGVVLGIVSSYNSEWCAKNGKVFSRQYFFGDGTVFVSLYNVFLSGFLGSTYFWPYNLEECIHSQYLRSRKKTASITLPQTFTRFYWSRFFWFLPLWRLVFCLRIIAVDP